MTSTGEQERARGYVRVSSARQVDEGNSIDSQTASIQQYARDRGINLLSRDIVIDDGVSGGIPLWDRSGKEAAEEGGVGEVRTPDRDKSG